MAQNKSSEIKINVEVDSNHIPEKIHWTALDGGIENHQTKALLLSVWDSQNMEALRIDLWTKDMPVDQMKQFFYQTLVSMANTYQRATDDDQLANTMLDFCSYFLEKIKEG